MVKWLVEVYATYRTMVEVEAVCYSDALRIGEGMRPELESPAQTGADVIAQLGEPWCYGGWHDLHQPGNVIVMERAHGYRYTEEEVDLLLGRVEELGLSVFDSWNGAAGGGCGTVSFACKGRERIGGDVPMSDEQQAALMAPRPKDIDERSKRSR